MFLNLNKSKFLHNSHHSEGLEDAPDKPPTLLASIIVIASFIFVFAIIAMAYPVFEKLVEYKENKINAGMGNNERIVYISDQKQILSSYKKIDDQYYQIPIQQAMKIVVANQGNIPMITSGTKEN